MLVLVLVLVLVRAPSRARYDRHVRLIEEFEALVAALADADVPYALVGGLAVAVWGAPRATKDIDLLVLPADVERVLAVGKARGFTFLGSPLRFRDGMELRRASKIEGSQTLTLDLLLVNENLADAWASRQVLPLGERTVTVISRAALIAMKAAAARPQDLADIEKLEEIDR